LQIGFLSPERSILSTRETLFETFAIHYSTNYTLLVLSSKKLKQAKISK
jgi:hypothetical protein